MTSKAPTPYRPKTPPVEEAEPLSALYHGPDAPDRLAVFLHGYGANGLDLMGIGTQLATALPTTGFLTPNAPDALPAAMGAGPEARQWFPLSDLSPEELDGGVQRVRPMVSAYLAAVLDDFALGYDRLVLMGFSQGAMMALEVAPRLPAPVAHVVAFSGALAGPQRLAGECVSRPPVFLSHGEADAVVPFPAMGLAATALEGAGFAVKTAPIPGLGHGIDGQGLRALYDILFGM